jgi:hypothetical protein
MTVAARRRRRAGRARLALAAAAGWTFTIARRYVRESQALAFRAMLDRLQSLNLIAWERYPSEIEVTVAADATRVIVDGP